MHTGESHRLVLELALNCALPSPSSPVALGCCLADPLNSYFLACLHLGLPPLVPISSVTWFVLGTEGTWEVGSSVCGAASRGW